MAKYKVLKAGDFGYPVAPGDVVEDPDRPDILIERGYLLKISDNAKVTASLRRHQNRTRKTTNAAAFAQRAMEAQGLQAAAERALAEAEAADRAVSDAEDKAAAAHERADRARATADEAMENLKSSPDEDEDDDEEGEEGDDEMSDSETVLGEDKRSAPVSGPGSMSDGTGRDSPNEPNDPEANPPHPIEHAETNPTPDSPNEPDDPEANPPHPVEREVQTGRDSPNEPDDPEANPPHPVETDPNKSGSKSGAHAEGASGPTSPAGGTSGSKSTTATPGKSTGTPAKHK